MGQSFRTGQSGDLIKEGFSVAGIEAQAGRSLRLAINDRGLYRKIAFLNGKKTSIVDFVGNLKIVLFSPEDFLILEGQTRRRRMINRTIGQAEKSYRLSLFELKKILRQRNRLLFEIRSKGRGREELDPWTVALSEISEAIQLARGELIGRYNDSLSDHLSLLNRQDRRAQIDYRPSRIDRSLVEREIAAGTTLFGPQRDAIGFRIDDRPIEKCSRGEQRAFILALKRTEIEILTEGEDRPIFLFDDLFSELDRDRRDRIFELIDDGGQVIATTTEEANLPDWAKKDLSIIDLSREGSL